MDKTNKLKNIGKLSYELGREIGIGSIAFVFHGLYENSKPVAVKRFQVVQLKEKETAKKEAELLLIASDHQNILRYFCTEMDDDFMYIATELCSGTLQNVIEETYTGPAFENEKKILKQVTKGLAHLHLSGIIHRDIKPTNILVFILKSGKTEKPIIKIADFGLSKVLKEGQMDVSTKKTANPGGTRGWIAPELYESVLRHSYEVDIFPLGCIFGYTLSKGKHHPFGNDPDKRSIRIKEKQGPALLTLEDLKENYLNDTTMTLIQSMIAMEPNDRPTAKETLQHRFFTGAEVLLYGFDRPNSVQNISTTNHQQQDPSTNEDTNAADLDRPINSPITSTKTTHNKTIKLLLFFFIFSSSLFEELNNDTSIINPIRTREFLQISSSATIVNNIELTRFIELVKDDSVDVNAIDIMDGRNSLQKLCRYYRHNNLIDLLLPIINNRVVDFSAKDPDGWSPLQLLCRFYESDNLMDFLRPLIVRADINDQDSYGRNPLLLLCRYYGHDNLIDLVQLFLERGADVNEKTQNGWSPLLLLCRYYEHHNLIDLVKLFLERGADVNEKTQNGWSPLLFLCRYYGHDNLIDLVKLFLERGANVNEKTHNGWDPLHLLYSKYQGDDLEDLILLLKDNSIDLKSTTNQGFTATYLCKRAFHKNKLKMSQRLSGILSELETKAKVDPILTNEFLRLSSSATIVNNIELTRFIELAKDDSVDVNAIDIMDGRNSLHKLCRHYGHNNLIDLLLSMINCRVVDVSTKDPEGWNSFQLSCRFYGHDNLMHIVRPFLERGADINDKTPDGWNALQLICRYYRLENLMDLVLLFIERGANINEKTPDGLNPLHLLCDNYQEDNLENLILLLKDHNIDLKARTNEGFTASYLCQTAFDKRKLKMSQRSSEILAGIDPILTNEFLQLSSSTTRLNDTELTRFIELVKDDSVDVNAIDIVDGRNSLQKLCWYYRHNNLIDLLLPIINYRVDVDFTTKDPEGWSPLQLICRFYEHDNLIDVVRPFIDKGADINEKDSYERSPLLLLCRYYRHDNLMDLVLLFIEKGAYINEKTLIGWNSLHLLCKNYYGDNLENLILLLKDHDIDLKATTNEGFTASYLCQIAFDKRKLKMSQRLRGILSELETFSPNSFVSDTLAYVLMVLVVAAILICIVYCRQNSVTSKY